MSAALIKFPEKAVKRTVVTDTQQFLDKLKENRRAYIEDVAENVFHGMLEDMSAAGLIDPENLGLVTYKDLMFVKDTLLSALLRTDGHDHPMQSILDECVEVDMGHSDDEPEGAA